jgi:ABC-2 type transport system permease protein
MIRLLRAELLRYWSRRAVRAGGVLAIVGILFACFLIAINSENDPGAVEQARAIEEQSIRQCVDFFEGPTPEGYESVEEFCEEQNPTPDPRFHLTDMLEIVRGLSFLLVILAIAMGASFVGAEWGAGTMTTVLTWEPRRNRVYTMKVVAAAIFVSIATFLVLTLLVLAITPIASWRGTLEGVDPEWLQDLVLLGLRSALMCALMATIGMALAMMARVTVAAVIVAFIYFAVVENVLRAYRPNWTRWLPGDNMAVFVIGEGDVSLEGGFELSSTRAIITIFGYAVIFFIAALMLFRSRDVS